MSKIGEAFDRRVDSIDFLSGLLTVIMLLAHTREYVHRDALRFSPTGLTQTLVLFFFTRRSAHPGGRGLVFLANFQGDLIGRK